MAEVLTKTFTENSGMNPSGEYRATELNGIIYLVNNKRIYTLDYVNNIFTQIYNYTNDIDSYWGSECAITNDGTYVYVYAFYSDYGYAFTYDPIAKTISKTRINPYFTLYTEYIPEYTRVYENKYYLMRCSKLSGTSIYGTFPIGLEKTKLHPYGTAAYRLPKLLNRWINDITIDGNSLETIRRFSNLTSYTTFSNPIKINGAYSGFYHNNSYYIIANSSVYKLASGLIEYTVVDNGVTKIGDVVDLNNGSYIMVCRGGFYTFSFIEYNLTYEIKNNDGSITYATYTGQTPIKKIRFGYNQTTNTVSYILTTLTGDLAGTYKPETPPNMVLSGYSTEPNSKRYSIVTDHDLNIYYEVNTTFYEVYKRYFQPTTTFDINLYQNSAEVNRVDKTEYIKQVGTLLGVLREECSLISPSITFYSDSTPTFNYVYIQAFSRYYYVVGITSVSKNIWRMSLNCDVLMTYKDSIGNLTAIIARQENSFNALLLDSELPAQANQNITVAEFPAGGFDTDSSIAYPFILTVIGA